ncbi:MAG: hypothetical protein JO287_02010 [Pseudonocardiales bacterium]|nr:hypothetical protein [Pseudonocardiales bacterium]
MLGAWLLAEAVGPAVEFGAAWLAAVFGTTAAVLDAPDDCGATCPLTG